MADEPTTPEWPAPGPPRGHNPSAAALVAEAETAPVLADEPVPPLIPQPREVDAALDAVAGVEQPAAVEDAPAEPEWTLDPDVPDEIADLLAEPEDDGEPDYEADNRAEPDYTGEGEYEDEEVAKLRQRAVRAEKRAQFLETERIKQQRAKWATEAAKVFPLAALDGIQATTRKQFLREAQARHNAAKPTVERFLQQQQAKAAAERKAAWGAPVAGGGVPADGARKTDSDAAIRRRGRLSDGIAAMFQNGELHL